MEAKAKKGYENENSINLDENSFHSPFDENRISLRTELFIDYTSLTFMTFSGHI